MKKQFLVTAFTISFMVLIVYNANAQNVTSPNAMGRQLFDALKTLNSGGDNFARFFLVRRDGMDVYRTIMYKSTQFGVSNWSRIEYVDYIHREFTRDGVGYSCSFIGVNLNGNSDYLSFGIYLLNIQTNNGYKILLCNDKWSREILTRDKVQELRYELENMLSWLD
jgi:hypothetical protein